MTELEQAIAKILDSLLTCDRPNPAYTCPIDNDGEEISCQTCAAKRIVTLIAAQLATESKVSYEKGWAEGKKRGHVEAEIDKATLFSENEQQIAEIVCDSFCGKESSGCRIKPCSAQTKAVSRINRLIAAREQPLLSENEQLKADLLTQLQRGKAMEGVLQLSKQKFQGLTNDKVIDMTRVIAKIDLALAKIGGGK